MVEPEKVHSMLGLMKTRLNEESALLPVDRGSGEPLVLRLPNE
jgi:hypothetical protein